MSRLILLMQNVVCLLLFFSCVKKNDLSSIETSATYSLEYIAAEMIETGVKTHGIDFGGISGMTYNHARRELFAISDDRSNFGPARYYVLGITLAKKFLKVTPIEQIFLKAEDNEYYKKDSLDPEALILLPSGNIVISTEMIPSQKKRAQILEYEANGKFKKEWDIPEVYKVDRFVSPRKGTFENLGFEGLSLAPSGDFAFVANEEPLVQDLDNDGKRYVRISRFKRDLHSSYTFYDEYTYELDSYSSYPKYKKGVAFSQGLSEIFALSDTDLFILERSFNETYGFNTIRIYHTKLTKGPRNSRPLAKKLILDLDSILDKIPDYTCKGCNTQKLDNFEAISLGPNLDGRKTLILASDNNFNSKNQKTLFLAFYLNETFEEVLSTGLIK